MDAGRQCPSLARQADRNNPGYFTSEVQCPQRVAVNGIFSWQNGQSFVDGGGGASVRFKRLTCLITRNTANATIVKSTTVLMNAP